MKRKGIVLLIAGSLLLSSCSLIPEEAERQTSPVLNAYSAKTYTEAACARGDVVESKNLRCTYVPVRTEMLTFSIDGMKYDGIFVEAGDTVTKGQVLMQLEMGDLEISLASTKRQIDKLKMQLEHLEQDRALALKRAALQWSDQALVDAQNLVNESYDAQRVSLNDSLSIAQMRLEKYEQQIEERKLRSPIDGTVTYVRNIGSEDRSSISSRVVTVADSTVSIFRTETEYWDAFEPGEEVVIVSGDVDYTAYVVEETELGLEETEKVTGKKAMVYFALTEPPVELEDGDTGTLTLILREKKDVLYVPQEAIGKINGMQVAYYKDENGLKQYKPVTVGMITGGVAEIVSGLEEGELVIVGY